MSADETNEDSRRRGRRRAREGRGRGGRRDRGRGRQEEPAARKPAAKKAAAKAGRRGAKAGAGQEAGRQEAGRQEAGRQEAGRRRPRRPRSRQAGRQEACRAKAEKPAAEEGRPSQGRREAGAGAKAERPAQGTASGQGRRPPLEPRHGTAGVATVVDAAGKQVETRELDRELFAVPADVNTLHLVVRAEQAARRRGTASTKTRGEVSGSTAKLYRQKGTGRARAGSVKSPIAHRRRRRLRPQPRSFDIKVNRKVVRKALAMALSNRAENGNVFVAAGLEIDAPSTAHAQRVPREPRHRRPGAASSLTTSRPSPSRCATCATPRRPRWRALHRAGAPRPLAGPHREGVRRPERGVRHG